MFILSLPVLPSCFLFYPFLFFSILSCPVLLALIVSYRSLMGLRKVSNRSPIKNNISSTLSCHVLAFLVVFFFIFLFSIFSCRVQPFLVLLYYFLCCSILSCSALYFLVLFYPFRVLLVLSCPFLKFSFLSSAVDFTFSSSCRMLIPRSCSCWWTSWSRSPWLWPCPCPRPWSIRWARWSKPREGSWWGCCILELGSTRGCDPLEGSTWPLGRICTCRLWSMFSCQWFGSCPSS